MNAEENQVPKELIIPRLVDPSLAALLEKQRGKKLIITVPKKGEKKRMLQMLEKNIEATFFGSVERVSALHEALGLPKRPNVIECFDISHLSGTSTVASMVQFRNGRADKDNYRRFKIQTVEGIDDFKAMGEVVRRRYSRLLSEGSALPDLIVVDGGKGQLSAAQKELSKLGADIPIISIAKQFEEIYMLGVPEPVRLPKKSKGLLLVQEIRDEAHRFAINYNRLLRKKKIRNDE